uniref:Uncharacterized protein n=2 Tax=Oryza TaxID=4527 RepID=A0A0E0Q8H3_ORYRU
MAVGGRMTAKPGVVTTDQERALPESRTTATDAPEAAGLEVTTDEPLAWKPKHLQITQSSYKEPGTAQELPHQLLHKSKAMDMFAQMLQVKWMRCYYWVMLLCDALGSSCCC